MNTRGSENLEGSDRVDYDNLVEWLDESFSTGPYGAKSSCARDLHIPPMTVSRILTYTLIRRSIAFDIARWVIDNIDTAPPPPYPIPGTRTPEEREIQFAQQEVATIRTRLAALEKQLVTEQARLQRWEQTLAQRLADREAQQEDPLVVYERMKHLGDDL